MQLTSGVAYRTDELRKAWKEAHDRVREAEERLGGAWTEYAKGESDAPDKALMAEVARLRRESNERLAMLLDEFSLTGPGKVPKEKPGG